MFISVCVGFDKPDPTSRAAKGEINAPASSGHARKKNLLVFCLKLAARAESHAKAIVSTWAWRRYGALSLRSRLI